MSHMTLGFILLFIPLVVTVVHVLYMTRCFHSKGVACDTI